MVISPSEAPKNLGNVPELSVSELSGALKRTLEEGFARVRVRGELSRVSTPASGHLYTALKDDSAVIDAVCWKTTLARLKIKPAEGLEVIATGRITTYPARSTYQLVIENLELAGIGAILKMLEDRRQKLAAEGLFDQDRKRPLPFLPAIIGLITSPTGAVIRDILHRLSDRYPVHVLLWPVTVQGDTAALEVSAAIHGFNALPRGGAIPRPDVLIVARGGGSLEDLMPFNEENVVRAAATSDIPLISAVGHETDTTLIDYAADRRAPTPTAAAEFAVPVRGDLYATLQEYAARLTRGVQRPLQIEQQRLATATAALGAPDRLFALPTQRLDHVGESLRIHTSRYLERTRSQLNHTSAHLRHPRQFITEQARFLSLHASALARASTRVLPPHHDRLSQLSRMLETLSFHNVLKRGFALVQTPDGQLVRSARGIAPGTALDIRFGDNSRLPVITK